MTLTAVVMSAGAWSMSSHLPGLTADDRVRVAAVSSPTPGRAESIAREFGVPDWSTDWRALLAFDPDIVVVSSPPVGHEEQVIAALEHGAHVLVEKPFALEAGSAQRMLDAARAADRTLLVGFGWPHAPVFSLARELVEVGEIGEIEHVMCHLAVNVRALLSGGSDGGWQGADASEPTTYTSVAVSGGGAAAVSMSHQLGLLSWITGLEFASVAATTWPPASQLDLHVSSNLTFSSGAGAAVSCASTHPDRAEPQWHLAIYGSAGQLWVDSYDNCARLVRASGEVVEFVGERASGHYDPTAPTRALIECALGAPPPAGMTGELATHVVRATDALYEGARSGRAVSITPMEGIS